LTEINEATPKHRDKFEKVHKVKSPFAEA
jgi:hypothetical protein